MNKPDNKWLHEPFSQFFEEPTRETLTNFLRQNGGEFKEFDFKELWPDRPKLARHVLALANSGGGCLVIGIRESTDKTLEPVGLSEITDKTKIIDGLKGHVPSRLLELFNIMDFIYTAADNAKLAGKKFQVVFVHWSPADVPFVSMKDGDGIIANTIYVRRGPSSEPANNDEIGRILEKRIEASNGTQRARSLKEHLSELQVLYGEIPRTIRQFPTNYLAKIYSTDEFWGTSKPNPSYPKLDYEGYVLQLLQRKQRLIERLLGVS